MVKLTLTGDKDLERALGELPKATARNTLRRVLKKAALPVQSAWQARAPKLTGTLERSIVVGTKLTRRQARDAKRDGKHFAEIHVGTSDPAGVPQEFGTFKEPAQPSGRPAWEATKAEALATIGRELGTEIEKSAARLARKAAKVG